MSRVTAAFVCALCDPDNPRPASIMCSNNCGRYVCAVHAMPRKGPGSAMICQSCAEALGVIDKPKPKPAPEVRPLIEIPTEPEPAPKPVETKAEPAKPVVETCSGGPPLSTAGSQGRDASASATACRTGDGRYAAGDTAARQGELSSSTTRRPASRTAPCI